MTADRKNKKTGFIRDEERDQLMWEVLDVFLLVSLLLGCLTIIGAALEFVLECFGAIRVLNPQNFYFWFLIITVVCVLVAFISDKWMKNLQNKMK